MAICKESQSRAVLSSYIRSTQWDRCCLNCWLTTSCVTMRSGPDRSRSLQVVPSRDAGNNPRFGSVIRLPIKHIRLLDTESRSSTCERHSNCLDIIVKMSLTPILHNFGSRPINFPTRPSTINVSCYHILYSTTSLFFEQHRAPQSLPFLFCASQNTSRAAPADTGWANKSPQQRSCA